MSLNALIPQLSDHDISEITGFAQENPEVSVISARHRLKLWHKCRSEATEKVLGNPNFVLCPAIRGAQWKHNTTMGNTEIVKIS